MAGYTSPFGPKMRPTLHVGGYPLKSLVPFGIAAGAFGGVALIGVLFLGEGIPRVQNDVLKNIPVIGAYWRNKKPIPASDNPF
ncbi:cytochrome b-c1 complex subunit 10 [Sphaerosporella brunnea]|uniref:Cytochrome b-c1 complex subunit 10 n=1 Tax=Sphaerosporella brunnea TaxID=1250544 RepID=A0A5J5ETC1_9PEZI|nr:cytochrome b-c1 complex subunit 10 [Sphaerosporella brunnea]